MKEYFLVIEINYGGYEQVINICLDYTTASSFIYQHNRKHYTYRIDKRFSSIPITI